MLSVAWSTQGLPGAVQVRPKLIDGKIPHSLDSKPNSSSNHTSLIGS